VVAYFITSVFLWVLSDPPPRISGTMGGPYMQEFGDGFSESLREVSQTTTHRSFLGHPRRLTALEGYQRSSRASHRGPVAGGGRQLGLRVRGGVLCGRHPGAVVPPVPRTGPSRPWTKWDCKQDRGTQSIIQSTIGAILRGGGWCFRLVVPEYHWPLSPLGNGRAPPPSPTRSAAHGSRLSTPFPGKKSNINKTVSHITRGLCVPLVWRVGRRAFGSRRGPGAHVHLRDGRAPLRRCGRPPRPPPHRCARGRPIPRPLHPALTPRGSQDERHGVG